MNKVHVSLKTMAEAKDDDTGVGKKTNFMVDPRKVTFEDGFNGRPINDEHVRAMADSFKAGATFPDIEVRVADGAIVVVDGHHRVSAAMLAISEGAEIKMIGAQHFRGNDADRVMLMITSQQGLPMTPLQLGVQYKKMRDVFGWEVSAIAARTGKSGQHVKDCVALSETNTDVQAMITRGEVSAAVALKTARKHGDGAGKVLAGDLRTAQAAGKTKVTAKTASTKPYTLLDAIHAEIGSKGAIKAETLCPQYAREIQYLRDSSK